MAYLPSPESSLSDNNPLPQWVERPRWWQHLLVGLGFIVLWCSAEWATAFCQSGPKISAWYMPAGLGLALLWGFGLRYIWALGIAAWIGGCCIWQYDPTMSTAIAVLKSVVYSAHAAFLLRIIPSGKTIQNPIQLVSTILCMLTAPLVMAIGGVLLVIYLEHSPIQQPAHAVLGWWVGDTIGILATAPLIVMVLLPMAGRWPTIRFLSPDPSRENRHRWITAPPAFAKPLFASVAATGFILLLFLIPFTHSTRVFLLGFIAVPALAVGYGLNGALLGFTTVSFGGLLAILWLQTTNFDSISVQRQIFEVVDLQLMMVALGVSAFFAGTLASMRRSVLTARLAGEQWTTLALQGSQMGRWLWDVDRNRIYTDGVLSSHLGYDEDQVDLDIQWWIDLTHKDDIENVRSGVNQLIIEDTPTWVGERRLRAADGSWRWISSHGALVRANHLGTGKLIAGIHRDITEQKRLQQVEVDAIALRHREEIDAHLKRTEKLDAIGIFASGIAHDFHNTLLAISASAQSARKKLEPHHAAARPLDVVDEACEQAREITASLLAFARGQGAAKEPLNLSQTLHDTARLLDALLPNAITISVHTEAGQAPWVMGNRSELQQVLMNLAMNARDAISDQGELTLTLDPQRGGRVELHIADNGCGMTPEVVDRAFEPFFTTNTRRKGTGLGLALVHGIITDHQGEVAIESTPGDGTRVRIKLPVIAQGSPPHAGSPSPAISGQEPL